jgi:hypothetical protein
MIKRKNDELQAHPSITPDLKEKENQFINKTQGNVSDPGEEYLFPYWDEYWDESDK